MGLATEWVQMSSGAVADAGLADPYLWAGGIASGVRAVAVRGAAAASSAGGNIGFGHGARHLIGTGLKVSEVEGAIASGIGSMVGPSTLTGSFWGRVLVNGQRLEYRAYTLKPVR